MLAATKKMPRKDYVVKYGYVYSDAHGNHYKAGEVVALSEKEADLAKHRVTPYVSPKQVKAEGDHRPLPGLSARTYVGQPEVAESTKEAAEVEADEIEEAEKVHDTLSGVLGRGEYEIK